MRWAHYTQHSGENGPQVPSPAIGGAALLYVGSPDGVVMALVSAPANPAARVGLPLVER
jgi:hypothetical protein